MTRPVQDPRIVAAKWAALMDGQITRCRSCGAWMMSGAFATYCDFCDDR